MVCPAAGTNYHVAGVNRSVTGVARPAGSMHCVTIKGTRLNLWSGFTSSRSNVLCGLYCDCGPLPCTDEDAMPTGLLAGMHCSMPGVMRWGNGALYPVMTGALWLPVGVAVLQK